MSIQEFVARRMQEEVKFEILYNKTKKNIVDLKIKEQDAYTQLVNEIQATYDIVITGNA